MKRKGEKVLKPTRPNAGIAAAYRAKLDALIDEMTTSYAHWIVAQYRKTPPRMAQDAIPAAVLEREVMELGSRWRKKLGAMAEKLARWFTGKVEKRSTASLHKILKDGGMAVEFQMTPAMKDVFAASVNSNVALIKSIGEQYHTEVQGLVMRSVAAGRDLGFLSKELEKRYGITKRRAALISRDQNNKVNADFLRARQIEAGIDYAIWMHSHAGKRPRPSHVEMNGKRYDVKKGMWDKDEKAWVLPGSLVNCRCSCRPVVRGFS